MSEPKIFNGGISVDDRGIVGFVNDFDFAGIKRFYHITHKTPGIIRGFHGHEKEGKYVYVVSGSIIVALTQLDVSRAGLRSIKKFVLSSQKPQILYIPPGHYNGFMNLEPNTEVMFFSTSTLEDSKGDDIRLPFDAFGDIWKVDYR